MSSVEAELEEGFVPGKEEEEDIGKSTHSLRHNTSSLESSVLEYKNIDFFVGGGKKKIISNVTGTVKWGHVLAVMGPSGAGKTTMINVLTLSALYGDPYGSITLNGVPLTDKIFKRFCYVVPQHDKHWPYLTTRETLMYAAELYGIADSKEDYEELVEEVIKKTGMETTVDTKAGSLSGGQRRRLSVAIALLKQPAVLFLDEPTSGLDAAAATHIMEEIRRIAKVEKLICVCTIHQPSTKVYNGFDQIMIMSKGREAFSGDVQDAEPYFSSIGYPLPLAMNPAEHFLDLVNSDFSNPEEVDKILDTWADRKPTEETEKAGEIPTPGSIRAGIRREIPIMFRRHGLLIVRDPILYFGRAVIFLIVNLFFAVVYLNARKWDQEQALNKIWITIWFIGVPTNMGVVAVYALNDEFKSVMRETKNGMLAPITYVLAKTILVIPIMYIFSIVALGISGYVIQDFVPETFGKVTAIWALTLFVFECVAEALSVWVQDPIMGMLNFMNYWFAAFLFGGFLISLDDMVWPFKVFYYIMPYAYYVRSTIYVQFLDGPWKPCKDSGFAVCVDEPSGKAILGEVGEKVFSLISDKDQYVEDMFVLLAIAVAFKLLYVFGVVYYASKASKVRPTEKAPK